MNGQQDKTLYRNAILYVLMGQGIPIIYYGTEQGFSGGSDPQCREALWPTAFNEGGSLYAFIGEVNKLRQQEQVWEAGQTQRYADDNFYAFTRGTTFVALTNVGSQGQQVTRKITYHPYSEGTTLCSTFNPSTCVTVRATPRPPARAPVGAAAVPPRPTASPAFLTVRRARRFKTAPSPSPSTAATPTCWCRSSLMTKPPGSGAPRLRSISVPYRPWANTLCSS